MCRLTGRNVKGGAYFKKCLEEPCNGEGGSDMCDTYTYLLDVCEKLAHYENAEEQGRLLILPCKLGDTVYYIHMDCPKDDKKEYCTDPVEYCGKCHHRVPTIMSKKYTLYDIGMSVYLTEQEAKEALEGMKE